MHTLEEIQSAIQSLSPADYQLLIAWIHEEQETTSVDLARELENPIPFSVWWRRTRCITSTLPEQGVDPRLDYLRERYQL